VITAEHMSRMKDKAIVGNIGHFDNEIDMAGLKKVPGIERINIKPQYDEWRFPDGHSVMVLAEGRLLNLGCATGHPSFVMSASFSNQVLAQLELHVHNAKYEKKVYMLPKQLDEEVARLHLPHLGVKLTALTREQAEYLGVPVEGRTSRRITGTDSGLRIRDSGSGFDWTTARGAKALRAVRLSDDGSSRDAIRPIRSGSKRPFGISGPDRTRGRRLVEATPGPAAHLAPDRTRVGGRGAGGGQTGQVRSRAAIEQIIKESGADLAVASARSTSSPARHLASNCSSSRTRSSTPRAR